MWGTFLFSFLSLTATAQAEFNPKDWQVCCSIQPAGTTCNSKSSNVTRFPAGVHIVTTMVPTIKESSTTMKMESLTSSEGIQITSGNGNGSGTTSGDEESTSSQRVDTTTHPETLLTNSIANTTEEEEENRTTSFGKHGTTSSEVRTTSISMVQSPSADVDEPATSPTGRSNTTSNSVKRTVYTEVDAQTTSSTNEKTRTVLDEQITSAENEQNTTTIDDKTTSAIDQPTSSSTDDQTTTALGADTTDNTDCAFGSNSTASPCKTPAPGVISVARDPFNYDEYVPRGMKTIYQCFHSDWRLFNKTLSCYKVFDEVKNITDAKKNCESFDAHLASIHSEQENEFIADLVDEIEHAEEWDHKVFFGLKETDDEWKFIDRSKLKYHKWSGEKSGSTARKHCAMMHDSILPKTGEKHFWVPVDCSEKLHYVCKQLAEQAQVVLTERVL